MHLARGSYYEQGTGSLAMKGVFVYCIVKPGALPSFDFIDSRESKGIASPDLF